jgi:GrpB-like predicted nucleotidyltransferase (UPF0157 family)
MRGLRRNMVSAIEHVGSTSVPGLAAKPIIDLDVLRASDACLPDTIRRLTTSGYEGDSLSEYGVWLQQRRPTGVLLPGICAVHARRHSRRNSSQIGVDRFEIPIRHVPIRRPRHDSQVTISNRVVTCAHGDLELF